MDKDVERMGRRDIKWYEGVGGEGAATVGFKKDITA